MREDVTYLIIIIYKFNKQNDLDDKKSNVKSLSKSLIKIFKEKSSVKSTKVFVIEASNLLRQIKSVYKYDDVI